MTTSWRLKLYHLLHPSASPSLPPIPGENEVASVYSDVNYRVAWSHPSPWKPSLAGVAGGLKDMISVAWKTAGFLLTGGVGTRAERAGDGGDMVSDMEAEVGEDGLARWTFLDPVMEEEEEEEGKEEAEEESELLSEWVLVSGEEEGEGDEELASGWVWFPPVGTSERLETIYELEDHVSGGS